LKIKTQNQKSTAAEPTSSLKGSQIKARGETPRKNIAELKFRLKA